MKISIFGSGYVGLVTAACLAEIGHDVVCIDVDDTRVAHLQQGDVPLHEPGLETIVQSTLKAGRLKFTTDATLAVHHGMLLFIAVGTPPNEDGSADLQYVLQVAGTIGRHMDGSKVIINKSTVPVGTAERVDAVIATALHERGMARTFSVVSNPEFLKEGAAVKDFLEPDRIIIGGNDDDAIRLVRDAYQPLGLDPTRVIVMSARDAEFTKYAANTMLATRISLMNEFANIAERLGVDVDAVRHGIATDPRIGGRFLNAGCGYGGSCFPKDVAALVRIAEDVEYQPEILNAVESVNARQKQRLFGKLDEYFKGDLKGKVVALWGLAFKPGTDDMREAPSRVLMERLWQAGATVRAHDPAAMNEARRIYGEREDLVLCERPEDVLEGADVLVLVTEWNEYRAPDFVVLRSKLRHAHVFDGRNILNVAAAAAAGVAVEGIGHPGKPASAGLHALRAGLGAQS